MVALPAEAFSQGNWRESAEILSSPMVERPNLFQLYEENIGPLTPMIADMLKDAEEMYLQEWIAEALEIAVKNNVRNWKYVEAILKRWKEKGKYEGKDRQDAEKDRRRYVEGDSPTSSSTEQPAVRAQADLAGDPECPHCGGLGYLRADIPVEGFEIGKIITCTRREARKVSQQVHRCLFYEQPQ